MNILLINPPFLPQHGKFSREQRSPAVTKSGTFYYPMWLCFATGFLEREGHKCTLIDAAASRKTFPEVLEEIKGGDFDLVVVDTSTPSIANDSTIACELKRQFGAFTVLVGPHPSALPEESLKGAPGVDAVARGEYEITLGELADLLALSPHPSVEDLKKIDGISFSMEGLVCNNRDREPFCDLDSLPFVSSIYKEKLNYKDYFYSHSKYPILAIITGRGCPHRCIYCVYPQVFSGRKLRYRSVANVVDEIEYILVNFPDMREIMFEDDTLTINKKRCIEFAEEIIRRGLKFKWSANSRADIDFETMQVLKKAGARLFCVGIESGVQGVLDSMKKALKVEQIRSFCQDARKARILVHACFILGNPGETKETLETTLQFAKEIDPDTAQFFPLMVYPGTEAFKWADDNGYLLTRDFSRWVSDTGMHQCVVSRPELTNEELVAFCDRARKEFYLRPGYIFKKGIQGLRDYNELKRLAKGALHLSKHILSGEGARSKQDC